MSTQYRDGSWSNIEQLDQAYKTFKKAMTENTAKKFVIGQSEEEVKEQQRTREEEIEKLKAQLKELEAKVDPTRAVKVPNFDEIQKFSK